MTPPQTNPMSRLFGLCCALYLASSAAIAQDAQGSNLQSYADLRKALLADGWKPDTSYGLKTGSGKSLYRYPEVVCGPQLCNAKWRSRRGDMKSISLLRGYGSEDHRVAPQ